MFKSILFLHIVVLVTANPLQGYVTYPLIQYKENYKNAEHPLFIQPSGSSSYVQLVTAQNRLTPFQNIPISYNDYGQRMYLDRNIQNQRIGSGIESIHNVNGYVSYPTDSILVPNIFDNFIAAPLENNLKNHTTDCNKRSPKRKENNRKLQSCQSSRQNNDNKEKKRNNQTTNTNKNNNPSLSKRMIREEKNHKNNLNTNEVSRKNKCTNIMPRSQETEKSENNLKDYINPNSKSKTKLTNKHSNLSELPSNNDFDIAEKRSSIATEKSKSKTCKDERGIREIDGYFDITEDCSNLESRCVRNNYNNNVKKNHPQFFYTSGDFSNHINAYIKNLMNSQYTNLNSNFPFNFDHLYNMHQYTNLGTSHESQKRQKKKKKTNKKKKKKSNKKKSNPNNRNTEQTDCEKVELSPTVNIIEKSSTTISKINDTDTALDENTPLSFPSLIKTHEIFDDVLDTNSKIYVYPETSSSYSLTDDFKELNGYDTEDYTPFSNMYYGVDDYYPDFRSDFMYVSKEDYDWNNFHERNYYICDKSGLDNCDFALLRESIKDGIVNDDQKLYPSFEKLVLQMPPKSNVDNDDLYRVKVGEVPNNDKILEDLNKEIIFITPPGLENPDFTTNMIHKDIYPSSTHEIYYQPSNKPINTKMSTYSDVKSTVISGKTNKFVDQNNVETNFGHSKVVKYGPLMPNYELNTLTTDFIDENKEKNSNDDITTLVTAESDLF